MKGRFGIFFMSVVLAAVAGSASAAYVELVTTTTYTGSGALNAAGNWDNGSPTNDNPGLVSGTDSATSSPL